jgi:hypothetical protein
MGIMKINGLSLSLFGILEQVNSSRQTDGAASSNPLFKLINQSFKE